jgi:hypothetical protein
MLNSLEEVQTACRGLMEPPKLASEPVTINGLQSAERLVCVNRSSASDHSAKVRKRPSTSTDPLVAMGGKRTITRGRRDGCQAITPALRDASGNAPWEGVDQSVGPSRLAVLTAALIQTSP